MMYPYYSYGYGYGAGPGYFLIGAVAHAVATIIVIVIALWLVRRFVFGKDGSHKLHMWRRWSARSGIDILNERYAKGEIGREEYEERKKTLLAE